MAEELNLIFHACTQGRTDVVQGAIDNIRSGSASPQINDSIAQLISTGRAEDGQTPLHVASTNGHADVIRCLLVSDMQYQV
jgi:ankyrin repeat protein